ncbi:EAL domain-containing protein [bacterium]|nr:EAL domain-containing protein [bacterium]MBU1989403.1 EAL domain-containing protein [bacterium]
MQFITLKSIVSESTINLKAEHTIEKALRTMAQHAISSVVIIDDADRPIGIFTERDALRVVAQELDKQTPIHKVMTPEPFCVKQTLNIHDAYVLMEEKSYRHLVTVDEEGKYSGIISEGDFLRHIGFDELNKFKAVSEVMTALPLIIQLSASIRETAILMEELNCDYAVVLDGKHPAGLVTERDIIRWNLDEHALKDTPVTEILNKEYRVITKEILLQDAAAMMEEHGVHQLIVIDDSENMVGLLSRHDVLHAIHGAYFEFLFGVIEQKNDTIENLEMRKKQLYNEKSIIEQSNLKYTKLFEAMPDGVVLLDSNTQKAVEFNFAAHDYLGYTASEFSKLSIPDYEIRETPEEISSHIAAIQKHGFDNFETTHRKKDGTLISVWVNVAAIELAGVSYMMAVYRDITKQKAAEKNLIQRQSELSRQRSFLDTLVNSIPDLIWLKDTDGIYLACNEMFQRFFNAKESEILGKNDFDFVSHELAEFFRKHDQAAIAAGGSRTNDEFLIFGDGSYEGYFETIKTPMKDSKNNVIGVLGVARDISERKRKDDEIEQIQSLAHIGTWEWDIPNDVFSGSTEAYRIFGIQQGKKVSFREVIEHFAPEDRERVEHQLFSISKQKREVASLYRVLATDGGYRWIKTHTEFKYDENQNPIKAFGIFQDLTEHVEFENAITRKDHDLNTAQRLAKIGNWRLNFKEDILEWSDETYRIFSIDKSTPLSYDLFLSCLHPDDKDKVDNAWTKALKGNNYDIEHRILVNNEIKWVREHARLETDAKGNLVSGIGTVQDITKQKHDQEKLEVLANYDSLTGLANRALLMSHLQNSIEQAKRNKTQIAMLMFDLDRFKDINDSYGHSSGDELLKSIAKRFSSRLREGDLISRIGGDEFAVVVENLSHPEDAGRLAQEMINALSLEYKLSAGALVHVGASAGIALYPDNGKDASDLLQHSDAALYKTKSEGRGTYSYYTDELTQQARNRIECENSLRKAIENQEFEVYYQPQVHIASGRILGAEALVRWHHAERGIVSPNEFIPVAEELGLISAIGEWVLNETCRQGKIWLDKGYKLMLAVNLSAHQIRYQNIPLMVEKALKKSRYLPSRLELEITESALMQREEEVVEMLHLLRAKGIRLAIDDFGTGYSSLSYLKRFPIDVLKIDKSFVDEIPYNNDDMAIVSAIIAMGQALGFQVLAEGTERKDQIDFLQEKGCTMYQGYFKSKPLPAAEFEILLQDNLW